jgi:hypothetical protein
MGIIFNVFEQLVARDRGEAAWGRLLEDSGLEGAYTCSPSDTRSSTGAMTNASWRSHSAGEVHR